MKAIRVNEFGGPEVMALEDTAAPSPVAGQVLIAVRAAGVNPVDTYIRTGTYTFRPPLPYTPGMEGAGDVVEIGDGVRRVARGDRVYFAGSLSGAYAQQTLCTEAQVYPLPSTLSYGQGAAISIPYGTAYRALFHRGEAQGGEKVFIHGASGGVGIAAVQIARAAGLFVVGSAGNPKGMDLVRKAGAHEVVNHLDGGHLDGVRKACGGPVDIIIEMLANVNLGMDLSILAKKGRVVIVGSRGSVEINPRELMTAEADIRGMSLMNVTEPQRHSIHAALRAGFENGTLKPIVSKEIPLAQAPRAHHEVIEDSTFGKIVLVP